MASMQPRLHVPFAVDEGDGEAEGASSRSLLFQGERVRLVCACDDARAASCWRSALARRRVWCELRDARARELVDDDEEGDEAFVGADDVESEWTLGSDDGGRRVGVLCASVRVRALALGSELELALVADGAISGGGGGEAEASALAFELGMPPLPSTRLCAARVRVLEPVRARVRALCVLAGSLRLALALSAHERAAGREAEGEAQPGCGASEGGHAHSPDGGHTPPSPPPAAATRAGAIVSAAPPTPPETPSLGQRQAVMGSMTPLGGRKEGRPLGTEPAAAAPASSPPAPAARAPLAPPASVESVRAYLLSPGCAPLALAPHETSRALPCVLPPALGRRFAGTPPAVSVPLFAPEAACMAAAAAAAAAAANRGRNGPEDGAGGSGAEEDAPDGRGSAEDDDARGAHVVRARSACLAVRVRWVHPHARGGGWVSACLPVDVSALAQPAPSAALLPASQPARPARKAASACAADSRASHSSPALPAPADVGGARAPLATAAPPAAAPAASAAAVGLSGTAAAGAEAPPRAAEEPAAPWLYSAELTHAADVLCGAVFDVTVTLCNRSAAPVHMRVRAADAADAAAAAEPAADVAGLADVEAEASADVLIGREARLLWLDGSCSAGLVPPRSEASVCLRALPLVEGLLELPPLSLCVRAARRRARRRSRHGPGGAAHAERAADDGGSGAPPARPQLVVAVRTGRVMCLAPRAPGEGLAEGGDDAWSLADGHRESERAGSTRAGPGSTASSSPGGSARLSAAAALGWSPVSGLVVAEGFGGTGPGASGGGGGDGGSVDGVAGAMLSAGASLQQVLTDALTAPLGLRMASAAAAGAAAATGAARFASQRGGGGRGGGADGAGGGAADWRERRSSDYDCLSIDGDNDESDTERS